MWRETLDLFLHLLPTAFCWIDHSSFWVVKSACAEPSRLLLGGKEKIKNKKLDSCKFLVLFQGFFVCVYDVISCCKSSENDERWWRFPQQSLWNCSECFLYWQKKVLQINKWDLGFEALDHETHRQLLPGCKLCVEAFVLNYLHRRLCFQGWY